MPRSYAGILQGEECGCSADWKMVDNIYMNAFETYEMYLELRFGDLMTVTDVGLWCWSSSRDRDNCLRCNRLQHRTLATGLVRRDMCSNGRWPKYARSKMCLVRREL
jgi:hypothetical protein